MGSGWGSELAIWGGRLMMRTHLSARRGEQEQAARTKLALGDHFVYTQSRHTVSTCNRSALPYQQPASYLL